jgi:predicted nucleotidyltransferase
MATLQQSEREREVLETAIAIVRRELDPPRIILFGSRAEGRHAPGSDFDLAVDVSKPPGGRAYSIREAVNDSVGLYSVDIVYLPDVDPDFRNLILRTGKVVYERKA